MTNWQLQLEDAAYDFLMTHGGMLTLRTTTRNGCCGGTVLLPIAEAGEPHNPMDWQRVEHGEITVYVAEDVHIPPHTTLKVGLDSFLRWHRLWVEGIDANT